MTATSEELATEESPRTARLLAGAVVVVVAAGVVVRFWDLGHGHLSVDESYTALAARMPITDLVGHIDRTDPHPPLSYVLFQPIASVTTSAVWLRMLGAATSAAALVVFGWWQRRRGIAGLVATAVMAFSWFELFYGRQMRMYGLLALGGVTAAWAAERWLTEQSRPWALLAVVAGTVCAFSHATGVLVLLSVLAIPLGSRSRAAWEMRAAAIVGVVLFAVLWGAHAVEWSGRGAPYPAATPSWLSIVVNETVAPVPRNRWLVVAFLLVGTVVIARSQEPIRRVWLVMGLAPIGALYIASLSDGVLIPKAVVPYAWAPALALGALVGAAWRRSVVVGLLAGVVVALMVLPYTRRALDEDEGAGGLAAALGADVTAGDAVAVPEGRPDVLDLVEWYGFTVRDLPTRRGALPTHELLTITDPTAAPSNRTWVVSPGRQVEPTGAIPCGESRELGGSYHIQCFELAAS